MTIMEDAIAKEPTIAVVRSFLKFGKVNGYMPAVQADGKETSIAIVGEDFFDRYGTDHPFMVDCDGDALWEEQVSSRDIFGTPLKEGEIGSLNWQGGLCVDADGQSLMTTVLVDALGFPLGVAYSNRQSAIENFRPKLLLRKSAAEGSYGIVTLRSRIRGIWPKGLKNPNADKDAPLPERLEPSSGNYLFFKEMRTNRAGSALMIVADVPEGHGFCHESYRQDKDGVAVYFSEKTAPAGATPYKSCFHRVLLL